MQEALKLGLVQLPLLHSLEGLIDAHHDDRVDEAYQEEEDSRNRSPDYCAGALKPRYLIRNRLSCDDQGDYESDHNCRMTKGEPRTHGKRAFSILQKLTGRVVNGHNVVSIHSMTQSQRVREDSQSRQPSKRCAYNE